MEMNQKKRLSPSDVFRVTKLFIVDKGMLMKFQCYETGVSLI